ncbi:MAG: thiamine pyrophosphate-binding protein [Nitrospirae bacterium RBG_13_39_12]|nr:MAG: thiamine pyrophosphate-binding protein [Nitrospirae bacterium RBG_13_39_12]
MIKLSDYVFDFIVKTGVKHVFLLPGGGCMHLVDSLGKNMKLEYTCCLHEQAAAIEAEAYGQFTNNLGVALVTTGPGGTNTVTGVAGAWIDSTPMLILSGQVKRSDMIGNSGVRQMGIQEVNIISIVKPITKYAVTVMEPLTIRYHLEKAVYLAKAGRPGPVWIDIPLDIQGSMIDESRLEGFKSSEITSNKKNKIFFGQTVETIRLLNESERPVILAGNGIRLAKAQKDFLNLINFLNIPVLTTWKSIDFLPENHKLFFGRPGSIGQRGANFIQQNADLIITIGARLDLAQIGYNYQNFAREAKKVIVDVDIAEIQKIKTKIDVPICTDAKAFIQELINKLNLVERKDLSDWLSRCKTWKKKYPVVLPDYWMQKKYVNTYVLVDVLSELMNENDVMVPGSSGSCSEITMQSFKVKRGQRILNTPGLGAMGSGLPASIGACIASGEKRTITIIGDGGLQHNIQELEVISRLNLPIKIFILNNNGYASIRNTHNRFFDGRLVCCDPSSGLTIPDTRKIASAYGLKTARITNHTKLKEKVEHVLNAEGPVVCEVMVDPLLQTAPKLSSEVKPDGSIVSKPLEDLWPFLDRQEFKNNMVISQIDEKG